VLPNTAWTDAPAINGGARFAAGTASPEALYLRNNIFRMTRYAFQAPTVAGRWDKDYNCFATADTARGLLAAGNRYTTDVAAYRRDTGQGAHTNLAGTFVAP
jgi:hypothetical protein